MLRRVPFGGEGRNLWEKPIVTGGTPLQEISIRDPRMQCCDFGSLSAEKDRVNWKTARRLRMWRILYISCASWAAR